MIKIFNVFLTGCVTIILSTSAMAASISPDTLSTCRNYMTQYGDKGTLPDQVGEKAAAPLASCFQANICQDSSMNDITNCSQKLSNLYLSSQIAGVAQPPKTPTTQPATTEQVTNNKAAETQTATESTPTPTYTAPTTEATDTIKPTQKPSTQPEQKKEHINWF